MLFRSMQIVVFSAVLFAACMCCHGELYGLRPAPRWLTLYFVVISAGGAIGGLFVALGAPRWFMGYYEYHTGLALVAAAVFLAMLRQRVWLQVPRLQFWIFALASVVQLLAQYHWFLRVTGPNLSDSDETILLTVFGGLLCGGLLVTGFVRSEWRRVCVLWGLLAVLQVAALVSFVHRQAPGFFTSGESGVLVLVQRLSVSREFWQCVLSAVLPVLVS